MSNHPEYTGESDTILLDLGAASPMVAVEGAPTMKEVTDTMYGTRDNPVVAPEWPVLDFDLVDQHYRILAICAVRGKIYPTDTSKVSTTNLPAIGQLVKAGLLRKSHKHFKLTDVGKQYCDRLQMSDMQYIKIYIEQKDVYDRQQQKKATPKPKKQKNGKRVPWEVVEQWHEKKIPYIHELVRLFSDTSQWDNITSGLQTNILSVAGDFVGRPVELVQQVYDYCAANYTHNTINAMNTKGRIELVAKEVKKNNSRPAAHKPVYAEFKGEDK
jgi:hypothetical protein